MSSSDDDQGRVALVVLSHGNIAREMVQVVRTLLQVDHVGSLDMALMEKPQDFLQRVVSYCRQIEQGKGILLLVDMGSLVTFGDFIQKQLGLRVRVVDRVDLVMVLEAARWVMLPEATIDEIADELISSRAVSSVVPGLQKGRRTLLTVCLSGEGNAKQMKEYLERHLKTYDVNIEAIGVIDEAKLSKKIKQIRQTGSVIAAVGTIDPELPGVPFIPFRSLSDGVGLGHIKALVGHRSGMEWTQGQVITEDHIMVKAPARSKTDILSELSGRLLKHDHVKPQFLQSVLDREDYAPTCIKGGIAIPHGSPQHVITPGIAVATLAEPITWWGMEVDVIFLLALRVNDNQLFVRLRRIFKDRKRMDTIRSGNAAIIKGEINDVLFQ